MATATLWGRLFASRGLPMFFAVVALSTGVLMIEAFAVNERLRAPDLGLSLRRRAPALIVEEADARWSGISPGAQLTSLAGRRLGPLDEDLFWQLQTSLPPGPVQATFIVDGVEVLRTGEARATYWLAQLAALIAALGGVLLIGLGLFSFLLNPGERLSWLFLFFCLGIGALVTVVQGYALPAALLYGVTLPLLCFTTAVGFELLNRLPEPTVFARPRAITALYATAGALSLFHLGTLLTSQPNDSGWVTAAELMTRGFAACGTVGVIARFALGLAASRKRGDARMSSQYRLLLLGVAVGVAPPALITFAGRLVPKAEALTEIASTSIVVFAAATLVALVRHNPLGADQYLGRVLGYTVAVGGLAALLALAVVGVPVLAGRFGVAGTPETLVFLVAAMFVGQGFVFRRLRHRIDAWFKADRPDAQGAAAHLSRLVRAAQTELLDQVIARAELSVREVLGAESVQLWRDHGTGTLTRDATPGAPAFEAPLAAALSDGAAGVKALAPKVLPEPLQNLLWAHGLAAAAAAHAQGQVAAVLGVSRKRTGFGYEPSELEWLDLVAAQLGVAIERSALQLRLGRYRLEKRIAVGGMAEVFLASQLGPGGFERKVAIKRLLPELAEDAKSAAMLLDEARIAAHLQHRNIAQTWEVGQEQGVYFLAMELVDGPSLRKVLAAGRGSPVPFDIWLAVALGVLDALDYAHHAKDPAGRPLEIVHRDVTPANVLISLSGDVKLVDFGIAVARDRLFRTQTGLVRGTMPYMSLEHASLEKVDARSDVYSAATTLYELLVSQRAFASGPQDPPPPPASQVRSEVPAKLDQALAAAMQRHPEHRTASARELAERISEALRPFRPASADELGQWVRGRLSAERAAQAEVVTAPMRPRS